MRFFDIQNTGTLDFNAFYRGVEKIGVIIEKDTLKFLFDQFYDPQKTGTLNYKGWAKQIFDGSINPPVAQAPHAYAPKKNLGLAQDDEPFQVQRSGLNSQGFPLGTTASYYEPATTANKNCLTTEEKFTDTARHQLKEVYGQPQDSDGNSIHGSSAAQSYTYGNEDQYYMENDFSRRAAPKSQLILIQRFKKELEERGGRGLVGLKKQFKLYDSNGNGTLEFNEFQTAINDFEIHLHPKDIENLYKTFDHNLDGKVTYDEFLHTLIGQMNKFRYEIVEKAFLKIAREGYCSLQQVLDTYDGARHPDVAMGKYGPEEAEADFRESFEMHHNTTHDYDSSQPVSLAEFIEFYAYHSTMIESDHVFDQLITGTWNSDKNNYEDTPYAGTAQSITQIDAHQKWKLDHHRKMFAGNESDILIPNSNYTGGDRDWMTTHKGMHAEPVNSGYQPAGAPTWPAGSNPTWAGALMDEGQRITTLQQQYYDDERQYLADEQAEPVNAGKPVEEQQPASP